jgi:hypothetical protein
MFLQNVAGLLSEYMALHPSEVASWELEEQGSVPNTAISFSSSSRPGWLYLSKDNAAEA